MSFDDASMPPRGATPGPGGVAFALAAPRATRVELLLFGPGERGGEQARLDMDRHDDGHWHAWAAGVGPGQHYGYRVHGPYQPELGHRYNPAKLLLDPFARAVSGPVAWHELLTCGRWDEAAQREVADQRDSAPVMPRSIVVDPAFDWGNDVRPGISLADTVIHECHVRGMTMTHPDIPAEQRGRFLGLASPVMIEYFHSIGVTSVQLMPVQQMAVERHLVEKGLVNYWGYNTVGFFAPDARFATAADGSQVGEFKEMVRRLHGAGLEVLLDVVLNHTGEGDAQGPMCLLRGLDNEAYYRLAPHEAARYIDLTGTGNTVRCSSDLGLELVMASLRYWASEMRVDGFRFDMAPALARNEAGAFDRQSPFFARIAADPTLAGLKLIAEPWDLGHDGYQIGGFPPGWSEWNGKFRDGVRRFWSAERGLAAELALRISGSSDLYAADGRGPLASVNYVTCHDGFTLTDLVTYESKHNDANLENNADGPDENHSRNWGIEGPTAHPDINGTRTRVAKSLIGTVLLARGVPMLSHGDPVGRTQRGNNNAYAHDDPTVWVDWSPAAVDQGRLAFVRAAAQLRKTHPVFRRDWFGDGIGGPAVEWLRSDGAAMEERDWHDPELQSLTMLLRDARGGAVLTHFNASERDVDWQLPDWSGGRWLERLTSAEPGSGETHPIYRARSNSLIVLEWEPGEGGAAW